MIFEAPRPTKREARERLQHSMVFFLFRECFWLLLLAPTVHDGRPPTTGRRAGGAVSCRFLLKTLHQLAFGLLHGERGLSVGLDVGEPLHCG